ERGRLAAVAPGDVDPATFEIGAVYVYGRDQGGPSAWGLLRRIPPPESSLGMFVPEQVELHGEWLGAGSPSVDASGAAFGFGRNVGGAEAWGELTRLGASTPQSEAYFGQGLALEGDELLVGASGQYASGPSGEVYAFDLARLARARWRNAGANPDSLTSG